MPALVTVDREAISRRVVPAVEVEPQVIAAYLFGSALGRCRPDSDIDIGIVSTCQGERERLYLEARIVNRLQPLDGHPFDVIALDPGDILFSFSVVHHGVPLYVRDRDRLGDFLYAVSRPYGELAWRRRQALAEVLEDLKP